MIDTVFVYLSLGPDLPVQQDVWEEPDILHHSEGLSVQPELPIVPEDEDGGTETSIQ